MSIVTLVSGGLDSTLMSVLALEDGLKVHPLFIDYGQRAAGQEWAACESTHARLRLPQPKRMSMPGFGQLVRSGLTDVARRINEDAFLPGRNLLLLVAGAAYASDIGARGVAIGLLHEEDRLFPDQSAEFVAAAQGVIRMAIGATINLAAPLAHMKKSDVIRLAAQKGIEGTYSCHAGGEQPCGVCVSCLERRRAMTGSEGD